MLDQPRKFYRAPQANLRYLAGRSLRHTLPLDVARRHTDQDETPEPVGAFDSGEDSYLGANGMNNEDYRRQREFLTYCKYIIGITVQA